MSTAVDVGAEVLNELDFAAAQVLRIGASYTTQHSTFPSVYYVVWIDNGSSEVGSTSLTGDDWAVGSLAAVEAWLVSQGLQRITTWEHHDTDMEEAYCEADWTWRTNR